MAIRKRSETRAQQVIDSVSGGASAVLEEYRREHEVPKSARLALEDDHENLSIRLKQQGYSASRAEIGSWSPQDRHIVAMFAERMVDDVPAILSAYSSAKQAATPLIVPPAAAALDAGEQVSVTLGEKLYSPIQYNAFRTGPFSATTTVRAGETREQAAARIYDELSKLEAMAYERERATWLKNLSSLKNDVRGVRS